MRRIARCAPRDGSPRALHLPIAPRTLSGRFGIIFEFDSKCYLNARTGNLSHSPLPPQSLVPSPRINQINSGVMRQISGCWLCSRGVDSSQQATGAQLDKSLLDTSMLAADWNGACQAFVASTLSLLWPQHRCVGIVQRWC